MALVFDRIAHAATRVVFFTPDGHADGIVAFLNGSYACDDVDATFRQRSARGVEFVDPPKPQSWGTFAKFRDPDGNTFVLSSA